MQDQGFGTRSQRPQTPRPLLTEDDKARLIDFGLSLMLTLAISFILGVAIFTRMPL